MTPPFSAGAVANRLLEVAAMMRIDITHLALHKLLFLSHGIHLTTLDEPLIKEPFEAWQYGPVLPSIYRVYRGRGKEPIQEPVVGRDIRTNTPLPIHPMNSITGDDAVFASLSNYGRKSPSFLVELTHSKRGPWQKTLDKSRTGASIGLKITDGVIRQSFRTMLVPIRGTYSDETEEADFEDIPFAGYGGV